MFEGLEKFFLGVPEAQRKKTQNGENILNLAVRARLKLFVEKYINRDDDFLIIRQTDKTGQNSIQWCRHLLEESSEEDYELEEILEFLIDHDPETDSQDEAEEDGLSDEVKRYEKSFGKEIDNELICFIIKKIWLGRTELSTGSILVFLPGFHEIRTLGQELMAFFAQHNLTPALMDDQMSISRPEQRSGFFKKNIWI
jgi:hypothetical protein